MLSARAVHSPTMYRCPDVFIDAQPLNTSSLMWRCQSQSQTMHSTPMHSSLVAANTVDSSICLLPAHQPAAKRVTARSTTMPFPLPGLQETPRRLPYSVTLTLTHDDQVEPLPAADLPFLCAGVPALPFTAFLVLLVEDDPNDRKVLVESHSSGYQRRVMV
jgi:hypothetical protein